MICYKDKVEFIFPREAVWCLPEDSVALTVQVTDGQVITADVSVTGNVMKCTVMRS